MSAFPWALNAAFGGAKEHSPREGPGFGVRAAGSQGFALRGDPRNMQTSLSSDFWCSQLLRVVSTPRGILTSRCEVSFISRSCTHSAPVTVWECGQAWPLAARLRAHRPGCQRVRPEGREAPSTRRGINAFFQLRNSLPGCLHSENQAASPQSPLLRAGSALLGPAGPPSYLTSRLPNELGLPPVCRHPSPSIWNLPAHRLWFSLAWGYL